MKIMNRRDIMQLVRADGSFQSDGRCDYRKSVVTQAKRSLSGLGTREAQQVSQRLLQAGIGGGHRNHPKREFVPRYGAGRSLLNLLGCF